MNLAAIHIQKNKAGLSDQQYRQLLVDCAGVSSSKDLDETGYKAVMKELYSMTQPVSGHLEEFGAIVGQVELTGCGVPCRSACKWGDAGLWHWRVSNARKFEKPIPTQGKLGLWNFTLEEHVR